MRVAHLGCARGEVWSTGVEPWSIGGMHVTDEAYGGTRGKRPPSTDQGVMHG